MGRVSKHGPHERQWLLEQSTGTAIVAQRKDYEGGFQNRCFDAAWESHICESKSLITTRASQSGAKTSGLMIALKVSKRMACGGFKLTKIIHTQTRGLQAALVA